jgi:hypothetical protein
MVHFARARCLGGDVLAGENQVPFQGKVDYDYILWIDSDQVFDAKHVFDLLESPYNVTCGTYLMEDVKNLAIVSEWNEDFFKKHGTFAFMTPEECEKKVKVNGKYFKVAYSGLGFMLIKKGVIEKLKYPYFFRELQRIGDCVDMCSEDVSFCRNITDTGEEIWIDSTVRVGHQKKFVI